MHRRTVAFEARLSHVPISQRLQLISLVTATADIGAMRRVCRFGLDADILCGKHGWLVAAQSRPSIPSKVTSEMRTLQPSAWCCQTNSNQSQFPADSVNLSGTKLTPLGESGGACQLEGISAGERSFLVEVVVDGGMDGGEFLQTSHAPKPLHRAFASSERKV